VTHIVEDMIVKAGAALLDEVVEGVSRFKAGREGMRLVLMPANVVPIGRKAS
jgi:hypothetical protein